MPYIAQELRNQDTFEAPSNPGELNWTITEVIKDYLERRGRCYTTYNEVVGVLECAKLELYRRRIADYENYKIAEHGDVY